MFTMPLISKTHLDKPWSETPLPNKPLRSIRTFARRETQLSLQQKQQFEALWPHYGLEVEQPGMQFDLIQIFGRTAPRVLDIGFGEGRSLLEMAKLFPEKDFIGVEVYRRGVANVLSGALQHQLTNVRVLLRDVLEILSAFPDKSLETVQIFFADPWPKTRHHKRRLVQQEFLNQLAEKLSPQGILQLATDCEDYANHMIKIISGNKNFKNTQQDYQFSPRCASRPLTKYETRALKEGREIRDLRFERL